MSLIFIPSPIQLNAKSQGIQPYPSNPNPKQPRGWQEWVVLPHVIPSKPQNRPSRTGSKILNVRDLPGMGQGSNFNQNWKASQQHGIINLVFTAMWCHHCCDTETYNKDWCYCCGAIVDSTWTSRKDHTWQNWEVCFCSPSIFHSKGLFLSQGNHNLPFFPFLFFTVLARTSRSKHTAVSELARHPSPITT